MIMATNEKLFIEVMEALGTSILADFGDGEVSAAFKAKHVEDVLKLNLRERSLHILQDVLAFSEWIASNYVRFPNGWIYKYADERSKQVWAGSTADLYMYWSNRVKNSKL